MDQIKKKIEWLKKKNMNSSPACENKSLMLAKKGIKKLFKL
jgi:hypothetical protein